MMTKEKLKEKQEFLFGKADIALRLALEKREKENKDQITLEMSDLGINKVGGIEINFNADLSYLGDAAKTILGIAYPPQNKERNYSIVQINKVKISSSDLSLEDKGIIRHELIHAIQYVCDDNVLPESPATSNGTSTINLAKWRGEVQEEFEGVCDIDFECDNVSNEFFKNIIYYYDKYERFAYISNFDTLIPWIIKEYSVHTKDQILKIICNRSCLYLIYKKCFMKYEDSVNAEPMMPNSLNGFKKSVTAYLMYIEANAPNIPYTRYVFKEFLPEKYKGHPELLPEMTQEEYLKVQKDTLDYLRLNLEVIDEKISELVDKHLAK